MLVRVLYLVATLCDCAILGWYYWLATIKVATAPPQVVLPAVDWFFLNLDSWGSNITIMDSIVFQVLLLFSGKRTRSR